MFRLHHPQSENAFRLDLWLMDTGANIASVAKHLCRMSMSLGHMYGELLVLF